jgi:hypothetical protein
MKPTPIFVAAAGFAMLGACTVETDENVTENADANATLTSRTDESAGPAADAGGSDTLGNQLNQLNESDAAAANEAENSSSSDSAD